MRVCIGCIVEGWGEMEAVGVVIRRIAARIDPSIAVHIPKPNRVHRSKVVKRGELEKYIELAARQVFQNLASQSIKGRGSILVLLDGDDDCPAQLGPELLRRAVQARGDILIAVVVAQREFEAWFLAAAESIGGHRGLPDPLEPPSNPEEIRGAKEWLRDRMPDGRKYDEPADQPALAHCFDLDLARMRADSFDKCYREIERLLKGPTIGDATITGDSSA